MSGYGDWNSGYGQQQPDPNQQFSQYPPAPSYLPEPGPAPASSWKYVSAALMVGLFLFIASTIFFGTQFKSSAAENDKVSNELSELQDDVTQKEEDLQAAFDASGFSTMYKAVTDADTATQDAWDYYYSTPYDSSEEDAAWLSYVESWRTCIIAVTSYNGSATAEGYGPSMFQKLSLPSYIDMSSRTTDCGLQDYIDKVLANS